MKISFLAVMVLGFFSLQSCKQNAATTSSGVKSETWLNGWVVEFKNKASGKCIDVAGNNFNNNAGLTFYDCHGGSNQKFRLVQEWGDKYLLQAMENDMCIDLRDNNQNAYADLQLYKCDKYNNNQQFWIDRVGDESGGRSAYQLVHVGSGRAVHHGDNNTVVTSGKQWSADSDWDRFIW